jgi:hypothetical protein
VVNVGSVWERLSSTSLNISIGDLVITTLVSNTHIMYRFVSRSHSKHLNFTKTHEDFEDNFREVKYA